MKCLVISDRQDDFLSPLYAALEARKGLTRLSTQELPPQEKGYNSLLEDTFLIVDVRQGFDMQRLSNLHAEFPGAPIVCFYTEDNVDTRTLVTFSGASAALQVDKDFSKVIEKGIELTEVGKEKYREPTGVIIYAGEFRIDTANGTYRKLSPEASEVVEAMAEAPFSGNYHVSGTLTRLQCSVLEALAKHRDTQVYPRNRNSEISLTELAQIVYKEHRFPTRNGLWSVAIALTDLFGKKSYSPPSLRPGFVYDPETKTVALLDSIYASSPS